MKKLRRRLSPERKVKMRSLRRWLRFGFWAFIFFFPKDSNSQPLYYKGKTIAVIEGRSPGGVGDLRTKSILPFLQKYIPGNPTVIPCPIYSVAAMSGRPRKRRTRRAGGRL